MKRKGGAKRKAREIGSRIKREPPFSTEESGSFFFCLPLFLQKRVCLGFPLMGKLFYKSAFLGLPRAGSGQPQADGWGALPKTDRFLPSVEKVKKRERKTAGKNRGYLFY